MLLPVSATYKKNISHSEENNTQYRNTLDEIDFNVLEDESQDRINWIVEIITKNENLGQFCDVAFEQQKKEEALICFSDALLAPTAEKRKYAVEWLQKNATPIGGNTLNHQTINTENNTYTFNEQIPLLGGKTVTISEDENETVKDGVQDQNQNILYKNSADNIHCFTGNISAPIFAEITQFLTLQEVTRLSGLNKSLNAIYHDQEKLPIIKNIRQDTAIIVINKNNLPDIIKSPFFIPKSVRLHSDLSFDGIKLACEFLSRQSSMEFLSLPRGLSNEKVKLLFSQGIPDVLKLQIRNCSLGSDALEAIVAKTPYLEILDVGGSNIDDVGAVIIAKQMSNLHCLNITMNLISERGAISLAENMLNLHHLDISGNAIGDVGVASLVKNLYNLHSLNIAENNIQNISFFDFYKYLPKLQSLNISDNEVRDVGAIALAEKLPNLYHLGLSRASVGDDGIIALTKRLPNLHNLEIAGNTIGDTGAMAIAENLLKLQLLNISRNEVGAIGASAFIARLSRFQSFNIAANPIGAVAATALAEKKTASQYFDLSLTG